MSRNVVSKATRQQAGQSGVRIPVDATDSSLFQKVLTGSGIYSAPNFTGRRSLKLTTHLHLVPKLRKTEAKHLLP
jgi:hypothetical protein